ncbi:hypothetical protein V6N13_076195 [Hibiscus sabdariffa]
MIGVFDAAAVVTLNNPRKYRRFDKEPPDRGGPGNRPSQSDVVVDADGILIPPSYKDSLLYGSGIVLRENRFNAISMPESNMCDDNDTSSLARPSGSVRAAPTAPLVFREKQRVKGKSTVTSKVSSGTHIRKPLTLSDFPVLSRSSHKGGSSKSVPTQVVSLDASKHSVVVIGENSYSNIQQPMQQFFDPPPLQQHLLGDPHDCSPGVGEIPDSTAVRTNPLDVYVAADDHSHERGGDHAAVATGDSSIQPNNFCVIISHTWLTLSSQELVFVHCRIIHKRDGKSVFATAVYASTTKSNRKLLWPHLRRLATSIKSAWILFGDFNATLNTLERMGCAISAKPSSAFQNLLFDYGLRDMGYIGPDFTWSRGVAQVRLDRFICNSYWDEDFPKSSVHHLLRLCSDHHPILLHVGPIRHSSNSGQF